MEMMLSQKAESIMQEFFMRGSCRHRCLFREGLQRKNNHHFFNGASLKIIAVMKETKNKFFSLAILCSIIRFHKNHCFLDT